MEVSFVNYMRQYKNHYEELNRAVIGCMHSGDFILRDDVTKFEENLAKVVGTKYCTSVNSCTDALYFSLKACHIGPGDEVILPSHTFVATAAAVFHTGATPVLVDCGKDHNISIEAARKAVSPRTKAIIPVHLNGRMCDMGAIQDLAKEFDLIRIEDSAQVLGAGPVSGFMACYSFYPSKLIGAFGDAGAVATDNYFAAEYVRHMRNHGYAKGKDSRWLDFGYSSRMDNIQAAVLNVKLKYLNEWIARRKRIADIYFLGLNGINEISLPYKGIYQLYEAEFDKRDHLEEYLTAAGVETMRPWGGKAIHQLNPCGCIIKDMTNTERIFKRVLQLPMYPELTDEEVYYVTKRIQDFYS